MVLLMRAPAVPSLRTRVLSLLGNWNRADVGVLALGLLGAGNLWARRGAGNAFHDAWPAAFLGGFAMVAAAGLLCLFAVRRSSGMPSRVACAASIAVQLFPVPAYVMPLPWRCVTAVLLGAVPWIRRSRMAWVPVGLAACIVASATISSWSWGSAIIDVFHEVQGSTLALIQGHNPYTPVYSIYLDSPLHHVAYGSASFNYGPAVVLLSVPARLLGDVRLTLVVLNIAILVAALIWLRRARPGQDFGPTVAALWVASPFIPLMILNAWTDVFCFAGLAWWLVLRDKHRNWSIAFLAVALASKPTTLPLMVPMLFWVRSTWRELLWATFGALLIVAPFALWTGVPQFVYDTITIFGDLPARRDSVSLDGVSTVLGHGILSSSWLLLGALASVAVFTLRRPRDYGDLLVAGAGTLIVVCFFAKQAFLNYDYNAAMALLFVIGAGSLRPSTALSNPLGGLRQAVRRRPGAQRLGAPATDPERSPI